MYQFLEFGSIMNLRKMHLKKDADMLVGGVVVTSTNYMCPGLG